MSIFNTISKRYKAITAKQFMLTGIFAVAFAAAIIGGFSAKQLSSAAVIRDTNVANSIDNSSNGGGVGAADATELVSDINSGKTPDLAGIYSFFGLPTSDYSKFIANAKPGMAKQDGTVVVDNQIVMQDAWSIGRTPFSYSTALPIPGVGTYQ